MNQSDLDKILEREGYYEIQHGRPDLRISSTGREKPKSQNAIPTMRDGIKFDSKTEACRYDVLKRHQQIGIISDLEAHPPFELQPAFHHKPTDARYRAVTHKADFRYTIDGSVVVEDWKGDKNGKPYLTAEYRRTRKLLLYRYPEMNHWVNCVMQAIWGEKDSWE